MPRLLILKYGHNGKRWGYIAVKMVLSLRKKMLPRVIYYLIRRKSRNLCTDKGFA